MMYGARSPRSLAACNVVELRSASTAARTVRATIGVKTSADHDDQRRVRGAERDQRDTAKMIPGIARNGVDEAADDLVEPAA